MKRKIVLGTRGSELALTQARAVGDLLRAKCRVETQIEVVRTSGDETSAPIDQDAGRKGLFTAELGRALRENRIDVAVHSAKDLPSEIDEALSIAAVLPRGPVEDLLIMKIPSQIAALRQGAMIATGSVRRQRQVCWLRSDFELRNLRGNVPTRLRKFAASDWDGIILARAGLERLGFSPPRLVFEQQQFFAEILPSDLFVPAGGQGVIALQTRADDTAICEIVSAADHSTTHLCLRAEREFLRRLQGDCNSPVGAHARFVDDTLELRAQVFVNAIAPKMASARGNDPEKIAAEVYERLEHELRGRA